VKVIFPKVKTDILLRLNGQPNILQYGKGEEDIGELEGPSNTQLGSNGRREWSDVFSFKKDLSFCRTVLSRDHVKKGRFARTIRANN